MHQGAPGPRLATFGPFALDLASGELRKRGVRVRLEGQPLQILTMLVERGGQPVTREELREALWPADTYVDFEHSLNSALKRLRAALGDSGYAATYIERLPKRGYRLLVVPVIEADETIPPPIAAATESVTSPSTPPSADGEPTIRPRRRLPTWSATAGWVALVLVVLVTAAAVRYAGNPPAFDSIVVLPFDSAGVPADETTKYMAFGLTDALTTELSRLGSLRVVSATSARWYKDAGRSLADISRELEADVVIEGTVIQEESQLRVTVQVIDAARDAHLWAATYTREQGDLLALQLEIAQAVAREIRLTLTPAQQTRLAARPAVDPDVQTAYLEGRFFSSRGTEPDWIRARQAFERAVARDPSHAPSYAGLADVFAITDAIPPTVALPRAREYALKALSLDDSQPATYATLGYIAYYGDWDWTGAERALRRAIDLDPGDVRSLRWYARVVGAVGRTDEALSLVRRAVERDPVSIATLDGAAAEEFRGRQFARGVEIARRMLRLDPNDSRGYEHVATNSALLGKYDDCLAAMNRSLELLGRASHVLAIQTYCLARSGRTDEAERVARELDDLAASTYVPPYFRALAAAGRERVDETVGLIERGYADRDPYMVELKTSPWLDSVRGDPRVQRLLRTMKFPD